MSTANFYRKVGLLNMPEQNKRKISTIFWTYSPREEAIFKKLLSSFGQNYKFKYGDLQLFILAQDNIAFKTESDQVLLRIKAENAGENNNGHFIEEIKLSEQTIFLSHNLGVVEGSEHIPAGTLLDYSSADHSQHQKMMSDIEGVSSEEELVHLAQEWVNIYFRDFKEELIRRTKHYALNLFLTLSIDIRSIQNIWEKKEIDRLKELLERISGQWERELSVSHSPDSQLFRLWYLLAGNNLIWGKNGLHPPGDVFLPKDQYQKMAQPLWDWINFFYGDNTVDNSEAWPALLELSGLKQQDQKFSKESSTEIVRFVKILRIIVKNENPHWWLKALAEKSDTTHSAKPLDYLWYLLATTDLDPQRIYQLSRNKPDYERLETHLSDLKQTHQSASINSFFEWLHYLNKTFDELRKEIKNLDNL